MFDDHEQVRNRGNTDIGDELRGRSVNQTGWRRTAGATPVYRVSTGRRVRRPYSCVGF